MSGVKELETSFEGSHKPLLEMNSVTEFDDAIFQFDAGLTGFSRKQLLTRVANHGCERVVCLENGRPVGFGVMIETPTSYYIPHIVCENIETHGLAILLHMCRFAVRNRKASLVFLTPYSPDHPSHVYLKRLGLKLFRNASTFFLEPASIGPGKGTWISPAGGMGPW